MVDALFFRCRFFLERRQSGTFEYAVRTFSISFSLFLISFPSVRLFYHPGHIPPLDPLPASKNSLLQR
jgi:hypothetical protein